MNRIWFYFNYTLMHGILYWRFPNCWVLIPKFFCLVLISSKPLSIDSKVYHLHFVYFSLLSSFLILFNINLVSEQTWSSFHHIHTYIYIYIYIYIWKPKTIQSHKMCCPHHIISHALDCPSSNFSQMHTNLIHLLLSRHSRSFSC